jgi:class 3 adenylate cyclase
MASAPLSAATIERLHAAIRDTLARTSSAGDTVFGERREVVVLAVQVRLRGAGEADAGDDDVWLDEALRIILSVVHRYAGTIDSFTTDGVLALFGGSTAHEDDAIRAARAALAIQAALEPLEARLRQQHERDFACAIGLHSGPVLHGQTGFGELDYTVIGDTVQRAVHLRDAASAGAIVVSADIAERTRGGFAYQPYEPAARHQADHAYALLGTSSPELGGGPLPTPGALIGRVRELARLSDALQDVLRHGSRR